MASSVTGSPQFNSLVSESLADGCVAYVNDESTLYLEFIRGPLTGQTKTIGHTGVMLFDIAVTSAGELYGVDSSSSLYRVNVDTGAAVYVGSTGYFLNGLVVAPSGSIYGSGEGALVTVNPASGAATAVGAGSGFSSSGDLAFTSETALYMTATSTALSDNLVSIDPQTGVGKLVGAIGKPSVYGLSASFGALFGQDLGGELLSIDPATGAGTVLATGGPQALGMATPPSAQPQPQPQPPAISPTRAFSLPPASKQCVSRRRFTIHVRTLPGVTWVSAVIKINGRRVKTLGRSHITALVDLVGLPKGTFVLSITARASDGRTVTGTRTYHTCVPKRKSHYPAPRL
ncbi:MAG TPA: hypothetical protein VL972_06905 [Solirubrobacteraceae bacterium]|nr:hypothetical protein [Solirubrobacteraceae bacterium]